MDLESWDRHLEQMPESPAVGRVESTVGDLTEGPLLCGEQGLKKPREGEWNGSYASLTLVPGLPRDVPPPPQSPTWANGIRLI